ncbi:MAG: T9SS type A sorting domain-containing protein [Ignavibacteria bacterium]|nr:T9SS type A sorting domain-containing protein [Ignavibacteria bacterium]
MFFNNSLTGWLSSENPEISSEDSALKIFKTTNGGNVWFEQFNYTRQYSPFLQLQFSDSLNGWTLIHYDAIDFTFIFRTTNGGNSWVDYALGPNGGYSLFFINESKGWAAGIQNRIYDTGDGGITWNRPNLLPSASYTSIFFIDSLTGWTVGNHGKILKTTTGGVLTNFTNTSTEIPGNYFLSQNYPNPFNPVTNLEFGISKLGFVSLKVYDVLGSEIKTLVNENKPAGNYEVEFDGSHLSSGIYFYSLLIDGNVIDTKRMILLK